MNMLMVFAAAVDPVQSITNLAIAILGAAAAIIMVVVALKVSQCHCQRSGTGVNRYHPTRYCVVYVR